MILLNTRNARNLVILFAAWLLAACGGGSDGGGFANIELSAGAVSATEIRLSWSAPSDISFSPYVIGRADENSSARVDSTTDRTYLVAGLSPATRYCFEIRDPLTGSRASNVACATTPADTTPGNPGGPADTTPPPPPADVAAIGFSRSSIEVSWVAPSDESGIQRYNVFRDGALIASINDVRFTDSGLATATNYCYRINAVDGAGNVSDQSNEVCATTFADDRNPSPPPEVSATYSDDGSIASVTVAWLPSSDDNGIAGYTVRRDGVDIGDTVETNFTDTSLQANTTYCYTVVATDVVGKSSPTSSPGCVRTSWQSRSLGARYAGSVAIALDAGDVPQVAYKLRRFDANTTEDRATLNLVRIGDTLEQELLDDSYAELSIWGEYSMDMTLDASGNAHILHQANPLPSSETLQYVVRSAVQTDKTDLQSLNPPLRGVDLAIDSTGQFHACIEFDGTLYYGNTAGGAWNLTPLNDLAAGAVGNNCSIAVDAGGAVHIAYLETAGNDLWYASNASGGWLSERVDQQSGSSTNTVYHTAIATDSAGFAHIAYAHDFAENDMEYATNASGTWTTEKVDDAGTVGYASDIVVDSTDRVYVLYEELADGRPLHLATRDATWSSFVLSSTEPGQDLSISVDSTNALHIVFNQVGGELTYLTNRQ